MTSRRFAPVVDASFSSGPSRSSSFSSSSSSSSSFSSSSSSSQLRRRDLLVLILCAAGLLVATSPSSSSFSSFSSSSSSLSSFLLSPWSSLLGRRSSGDQAAVAIERAFYVATTAETAATTTTTTGEADGRRHLHERSPPPVIADLDGDGVNEMVVVDRAPSVNILRFQQDHSLGATMTLTHSASLLSHGIRASKGWFAVAMATGYLDAYDPSRAAAPREQVIVLLTHGWNVLCFDHKLDLLWEHSIQAVVPLDGYLQEASITITPAASQTGRVKFSRGLVVVGAQMARLEDAMDEAALQHEHLSPLQRAKVPGGEEEEEETKNGEKNANADSSDSAALRESQLLGHFNYYALRGEDGALVWKHEKGDFLDNVAGPMEQSQYLQHHFKMDARVFAKHADETDWRLYRDSFLNFLPFRWRFPEDAKMFVSTFHKNQRSRGGPSRSPSDATTGDAMDNVMDMLQLNRDPPSSPTAAAAAAHDGSQGNVIVSLLHDGIEVLRLSSGKPISRLSIAGDLHGKDAAYGDVNGDGVVDHVMAVAGEAEALTTIKLSRGGGGRSRIPHHNVCFALVRSGVPPVTALFNGSICNSGGAVDELFMNAMHYIEADLTETETLSTTSPLLVPFQRSPGYRRLHNSVFLVSTGKITDYSPGGALVWQIDTDSGWNSKLLKKGAFGASPATVVHNRVTGTSTSVVAPAIDGRFTASMKDFVSHGFRPTLELLEISEASSQRFIVAIGWNTMTVVSTDGSVVASLRLAEPPTGPPIFGDFNSDGYTDIVVPGRIGYHGFSVQRRAGTTLFAGILFLLILVMVLVFAQHSPAAGYSASSRATATGGRVPAATTARRKRGTDDWVD